MVDQDTVLTKKFQKEMNAGIASLVLLSVMGQAEEPMYGYQVAKLLEDQQPGNAHDEARSTYILFIMFTRKERPISLIM